ncbi:hypothetical protein A9P82_04590 [Arachidicoccus ginsenosidimutans]|uniref:tetratricopeptide repeat protein n=1 Tax=Arachidicoccus sp. BS20 TaxID=1850526 RepID=UPI0007F078CE|nr:hypothetical protein [Arachidicoccus sp. BS20]ANI88628.1 hypothetical protein A9P82_04590 [Arachidicoccus sp. BS20]
MKFLPIIIIIFAALILNACKNNSHKTDYLKYKVEEVNSLTNFLSTKPDSAGLRLIVANKLDSIGEYKNALLQIDTLLKNDSNKYGLWVAKANILSDSGNFSEAKKSLQKAVAIYPGNEAVLSLSEILANEKNDSCLILAKQFKGIQNAYYNYISALYFYNKDSLAKADSLLNKSTAQNAFFTKPYLVKGKILQQNNQLQNALSIFKAGLKFEPKNISLLNAVAETFIQMKEADSAKTYFAESLATKPFQPRIPKEFKN